ncbi:MAG: MBL fold metallo-hydrolase, partial [Vulcanococcus sp.]
GPYDINSFAVTAAFAALKDQASVDGYVAEVLLGKPDVLILGVGGGAKVYDGAEAAAVVRELSPKRVIPVQYVSGTTPKNCDQSSVEPFLEALKGTSVKRVGRVLSLPGKLSDTTQIDVMR